jgi:hypothetical protein
MITILKGHVSPETAYVVDDYPYGFRLRCKIRYWLEFKENQGFRLVSQTTNPKAAGTFWNKPKASTYCRFGGCMILNDEGHVTWHGLTEYCNGAKAASYRDTYGEGVPEAGQKLLDTWVKAKLAYDARKVQVVVINA